MELENKIIVNKGIFNNINVMENTLESFKQAWSNNFLVRFSLKYLKDGNIIILASTALRRLFNLKDELVNYDYEDLEYIATFKIPKLENIIPFIKTPTIIFIPTYSKKLLHLIEKQLIPIQNYVIIESDSLKVVKYFKKQNFKVSLYINNTNKNLLYNVFKPDIYNLEIGLLDRKQIKLLKENYYVIGSVIKTQEELTTNKTIYNNLIIEYKI